MFTEALQGVLDAAKREAWAEGASALPLDALLGAAARDDEGRVLLSIALDVPVATLRERYPPRLQPGTLEVGPMAPDAASQDILAQARALAAREPDSVHPGWISPRHLVAALAMSRGASALLEASCIGEERAVALLAEWHEADLGVPRLSELSERLRRLRDTLLARVVGQDHAVSAFVEGLFNAEIVAQADAARKQPRALFVFAGPPGVGKTYLAECGAAALGRPYRRFDMSMYADHQQYLELIGFSPSYKDAKSGLLTGFVAENPTAFLLFDEIEKAHLSTIQLFLQILDAGILEDRFTSQPVCFRDTTLVFTTNAGTSLYDRPNAAGILAASAGFHRRTLLDALRTEKGPRGEPLFPPAICSRLATGCPVLFNHLGVDDLTRIARAEIERVGSLLEQQYYKTIRCDDVVPLALLLREGATVDARTLRAQAALFVKSELHRFSELLAARRLERVWSETSTIEIGLDPEDAGDPLARDLFAAPERFKVLLVADPALADLYARQIGGIDWLSAASAEDALQLLSAEDVELVLLDAWLGCATEPLTGTFVQFDRAPLGSRAFDAFEECLRLLHERMPQIPVYLLSRTEAAESADAVDEEHLIHCIRGGGARGVVATSFVGAEREGWEGQRDALRLRIAAVAARLHREGRAAALARQHQVLSFDIAPAIDRARRTLRLRLRRLRLERALAAEDVGAVLGAAERPSTRFEDIFGAETAREALGFVVDWLREPRRYAAVDVRPPRGILLTGPPGTGKTMLARALAGEAEVAFLVASGTDFVTVWQGSGPQNVRDLFARARRNAPAVVFIDEIDAIGRKRVGAVTAGRAEETTLNALLTEMDGFGQPTQQPVIVLAATNLADHLDDALRRRFDREIEVPPPDRAARAAFLRHELAGRRLAEVTEEACEGLARRSVGLTLASLKRVVNEAAVIAARGGVRLTDAILEEAFERSMVGEAGERPDERTRERIARHEAGHALVGWLTGQRPVQVTIVGRGAAAGYVEKETDERKAIFTEGELRDSICQAMAGRAAELLCYGEAEGLSTGVASDLRQATGLAERMTREYGMSAEIGQVHLDERDARQGPLAESLTRAVERLVRAELERAGTILVANRQALDRLVAELLERDRLTGPDLERLLAGARLVSVGGSRLGGGHHQVR